MGDLSLLYTGTGRMFPHNSRSRNWIVRSVMEGDQAMFSLFARPKSTRPRASDPDSGPLSATQRDETQSGQPGQRGVGGRLGDRHSMIDNLQPVQIGLSSAYDLHESAAQTRATGRQAKLDHVFSLWSETNQPSWQRSILS